MVLEILEKIDPKHATPTEIVKLQHGEDQMLSVVALLGKRDTPTDGLEDYCTFLGAALQRRRVETEKVRVNWHSQGWLRSLLQLWRQASQWRGKWVLLQFTSLSWSRRGFPFAALLVIRIVRARGAYPAVVYHEPFGITGRRWIDRIRNACQEWTIRRIYDSADLAILPDSLETIPWLPKETSKAVFIPIGANLPEPERSQRSVSPNGMPKTVVIYCLSDSPNRVGEIHDISHAVQVVSQHKDRHLRVVFMGRGTPEAQHDIDVAFRDVGAEVLNLGIQSAEEVSRILAAADVMLCVRGRLFPRRGSALAGITCGVPILAYAGAASGPPLEDAGIEFVEYRDVQALARALDVILSDQQCWQEMHVKNLLAHDKHFSWDAIAGKLIDALGRDPVSP
jgi:glycosyltransferase involved in cell wall biosynthesis